MSLLNGGLQSVFGAAFGGLYLEGEIHRVTRTEAGNGDVTVAWADSPIRFQPDRITEAMRRADGFTDRDAAFLIIQAGVEPFDTDAEATMGGRWAIKSVDADPANTHWVVRASPA